MNDCLFKLLLEQLFSCSVCCILGHVHQSERHEVSIEKASWREVRVEKCMLSGCFGVPQLLSGSSEMIPEIVCQQDFHLCLMEGIDTEGKIAALLRNI